MRNYDFHQLLSPEQFQTFATELVSIRENIALKSNPKGTDGGIDSYDLNNLIICQVKNHKNDFEQLKKDLKKEIKVAKFNEGKKYILVTSVHLKKEHREEIVKMFEGHLKNEDIIDKYDINILLTKSEYHDLEVGYINLLVPNSFVLEHFLSKEIHSNIYTQTKIEISKIKNDQKIFSVNQTFYNALDHLIKNKIIIITGEPGIGKSILGRMLCSYLIEDAIHFYAVKNVDELYEIYNEKEKQIYFFDDFWGDVKYKFKIEIEEQNKLIEFINFINKSDNKWLVITSREYILNEGTNLNKRINKNVDLMKYTLNIKDISKVEKFNILYNHIKTTNLSWSHLKIILYYWEDIVSNKNFTPRLIKTFFENYEKYKNLLDYDLYFEFINYLNHPYDYWEEVINEQSFMIKLLLILIALENDNMLVETLLERYNYIVNNYHLERETNNFNDNLKQMEDTFTITNLDENNLIIQLKNPSYREFILEYLSNNVSNFIRFLFDENLSLNSLVNLWICINKNYYVYRNLKEAHKLEETILRKIDDSGEEHYLLELATNMDFKQNSLLEKYILNKVENILYDLEDYIYIDMDKFELLFNLLDVIGNKYDFGDYIYETLSTITFCSDSFYEIEHLVTLKFNYPEIYDNYFKDYKQEVKDNLKRCALNDIYSFREEKDIHRLEYFLLDLIPDTYKKLNLHIPKKILDELNIAIDEVDEILTRENYYNKDYNFKKNDYPNSEKEDLTFVNTKIEKLIGTNQYIEDDKIEQICEDWNIEKDVVDKIRKLVNQENLLSKLTNYHNSLFLLCDYIKNKKTINIADFIKYLLEKNNIKEEDSIYLNYLAIELIRNKMVVFCKEELKNLNLIKVDNLDLLLESDFFVKNDKWYHFIHPLIQFYFFINMPIVLNLDFDIVPMYQRLYDYTELWGNETGYFWSIFDTHELLKSFYSDKWYQDIIKPNFEEMKKNINTKNELSIATSVIKLFNILIHYDYEGNKSYTYSNPELSDLITSVYDMDIITTVGEFFEYENVENLLDDKNTLDINENINKKQILNIIEKTDLINILNKLYKDIIKFLE